MFKFWKGKAPPTKESEPNPFKDAIAATGIDRRQYLRVCYTPVGAIGDLPSIQWENHFLEIVNLSEGGMLILAPPMGKALTGQQAKFRLHWPTRGIELWNTATLLRVNGKNWHFKFAETDPKYLAQLPGLIKTGLRAQKTCQLKEHEIPPGENIVEVWMSLLGDFVMFQVPPAEGAEIITLTYDGTRYRFEPRSGLVIHKKTQTGVENTPVSRDKTDTVLIFLSNLGRPTPRLRKLINAIVDHHYRSESTKVS